MKKKKNNLKKLLILFLLSRVITIAFLIFKQNGSILELYDCVHYLTIAKVGYNSEMLYAFFPLYPILIKLLHFIIPSYEISGFLISNVASFVSLWIINDLTKNKDNFFLLLCFVFSPIFAFNTIIYTESLYMFLTLLGYYLYKKNKLYSSALIVGLCILTRNTGIILWGAIGLDMLYRLFIKKDKSINFKKIFIFALISISIGSIYPIYLHFTTGSAWTFVTIQDTYWHRESMSLIKAITRDIAIINKSSYNPIIIIQFLENWLSLFICFIMGIKLFKKDKVSSIYMLVSLLAFVLTFRNTNYWNTLSSVSLLRYTFNLFPFYLYLLNNTDNYSKKNIIKVLLLFFLFIFNTIIIYLGAFLA